MCLYFKYTSYIVIISSEAQLLTDIQHIMQVHTSQITHSLLVFQLIITNLRIN